MSNKKKIIKTTFIGIAICLGSSNAEYKAVIFPTKYIMAEKLTPKDWYSFFESDCSSGTITTFPDLNGWETTSSNPIICNGSSTSMPNVSDLSKLSTNMTIGSSEKFYNTENLLGLKGLRELSQLSLYIKGEGAEFNQLENEGNVSLNLNESGVKKIIAKGVKGYQFKIMGDTTNKSNVNEIILDNVMYGYSYSPVLIKNIKNANIKTTKDSLKSMVFIEDSYINDVIINKDADLNNLVSGSGNDYVYYQFHNSALKNIVVNNIQEGYLNYSYMDARTEPDSFYKINSIIINESDFDYAAFEDLKDVSRIEVKDSIYSNNTFRINSDGGNLEDGFYLINNNKPSTDENPYHRAYFEVKGFNNINKIDLNDVTEMDGNGSLYFEAINEIKTINLNNFTASFMDFKASNIGDFTSTMTSLDPVSYGTYIFTGNINNITFNHEEIPFLNINNDVGNLTLNGLKKDADIVAYGDIKSLIINTATTLDNLEINLMKNIENITINDNDPSNNLDDIIFNIDTTKVLDHNVFKSLNTATINIRNTFDGDLNQPFSIKFSSSEPFCLNYGVSTKVFINAHTGTLVPKSSICN